MVFKKINLVLRFFKMYVIWSILLNFYQGWWCGKCEWHCYAHVSLLPLESFHLPSTTTFSTMIASSLFIISCIRVKNNYDLHFLKTLPSNSPFHFLLSYILLFGFWLQFEFTISTIPRFPVARSSLRGCWRSFWKYWGYLITLWDWFWGYCKTFNRRKD